jgi:hypothetical protein
MDKGFFRDNPCEFPCAISMEKGLKDVDESLHKVFNS